MIPSRGYEHDAFRSASDAARGGILADEVICFPGRAAESPEYVFRRIVKQQPGADEPLVFLTNHLGFGPTTVAAIYKDRWQVELFFRWIKQHLRIQKFYGVSENAVKTQIWIAIAVYVLVAIVRKRLKLEASLYQILQILSVTLFEKTPISQALQPSDSQDFLVADRNQLILFDF